MATNDGKQQTGNKPGAESGRNPYPEIVSVQLRQAASLGNWGTTSCVVPDKKAGLAVEWHPRGVDVILRDRRIILFNALINAIEVAP